MNASALVQKLAWSILFIGAFITNYATARDLSREPTEHPLYRTGKCFSVSQQFSGDLPKGIAKNYEIFRQLKKVDIACIADSIRIDQPLRSWGGDVVIFASRVEISAPIDVRPYFLQSSPFDRFQEAYRGWENVLLQPPQLETWNDAASVEAYRKMSDEHYKTCQNCISIGNEVYGPNFPAGLTAANIDRAGYPVSYYINNLKPGLSPPDLGEIVTWRSGAVTIIASDISIAENLKGEFAPQEVCEKATEDSFGINASGVRGGRGGLGAVASCSGRISNSQFRCADELYQNRSLSGYGGSGGFGGDVTVIRLDAPISGEFSAQIQRGSTVAGGGPGPRTRFRLPPATAGGWGYLPYVPMCARAFPDLSPNGKPGLDGTMTIRSATAGEGLALFYKMLVARDARGDYLFDELAMRAIESKFIFTDSHISFFDKAVAEAVLHGYARIAADLHSVATGSSNGLQYDGWKSLGRVTADDISSKIAIAPSTYQVIKDWPLVDASNTQGFSSFFQRSGGYLNIDDEQSFRRLLAEATRIDLGKQLELSAVQLGELAKIKGFVAESMLFNREIQIRERLKRLQNALSTLEQQLAISSSGGFEGLVRTISEAKGPLTGLYAAVSSGNAWAVVESLGPSASALNRIYAVLHVARPDASGIPDLKAAIEETNKELGEFLIAAAQIRAQNTRSEEYAGLRALRERGALRSKLNGRIAVMPDLLRLTVLTYAVDPIGAKTTLGSNANAVWTFARRFPDEEPLFRLRPGPNYCGLITIWDFGKNKGRCGIETVSEDKAIYLLTGDVILDQMPALTIDGNRRRTIVFDTLGYPYETKNFTWSRGDLGPIKLRGPTSE